MTDDALLLIACLMRQAEERALVRVREGQEGEAFDFQRENDHDDD